MRVCVGGGVGGAAGQGGVVEWSPEGGPRPGPVQRQNDRCIHKGDLTRDAGVMARDSGAPYPRMCIGIPGALRAWAQGR